MSLKAFHVIFVAASVLLALGFGTWEVARYRESGQTQDLLLGGGSFVVGVGLLVYGRYFLKKLKHISYL